MQRDLRGRSLSASSAPNLGSLSNTWSGSDQSAASGAPGMGAVIRTKLQLVDLAGSECVGKCQSRVVPLFNCNLDAALSLDGMDNFTC